MTKEQKEKILTMVSSGEEEMRDLGIIILISSYRFGEWWIIPQYEYSAFSNIRKTYQKEGVGGIIAHLDNRYSIMSMHIMKNWKHVFDDYPKIIV